MLQLLAPLAAAAMAPAPVPESEPFLRFRVERTLRQDTLDVEVGAFPDHGATRHYWFRIRYRRPGQRRQISSTTTLTCPAARAPLEALEVISWPRLALAEERNLDVVADGSRYRLEAHLDDLRNGGIVVTSSGDPLKSWAETMLSALQPCWNPAFRS